MDKLNTPADNNLLFAILEFIAPLPPRLHDRLKLYLKREEFPKKHLLLKEGQTARRIYFIANGFARSYYIDNDGREHTLWFMGSGDLMISVYSFFTRNPAYENIELLEDTVLHSITWRQLNTLYHDFPEFNRHRGQLNEKYYVLSEQRAIMLRHKKPIARYQLLLKQHPDILQKAALGHIASYLGITPETLSRLRSLRHS